MSKYRASLPQLDGTLFLTDGGLETTMVFLKKIPLPEFAAITLMDTAEGRQTVREYFEIYLDIARRYRRGFILESVTWRASAAWAGPLGYSEPHLERLNREAIRMLHALRADYETPVMPLVISGCIGPKGDGYDAAEALKAHEAQRYHAGQVRIFREEGADLVTAMTLAASGEAIGITRAAQAENMPVVISFTVETNGSLPSGQPLAEAIAEVDAASGRGPVYYMINCAHPSHFMDVLQEAAPQIARIGGIRANASCKSHAELDEATELDRGDPAELGYSYKALKDLLSHLVVLGGCCGTDHHHVAAMAESCFGSGH